MAKSFASDIARELQIIFQKSLSKEDPITLPRLEYCDLTAMQQKILIRSA